MGLNAANIVKLEKALVEKPSESVLPDPQLSKPNTKLFINNLVVTGSTKTSSQQPQNSRMLSSFFLVNKDSEYLIDNIKSNRE